MSGCGASRNRLRCCSRSVRHTTADRMAERRKLDRRRVYSYGIGLRKRVEASMSRESHLITLSLPCGEQKAQNSINASMEITIKNGVSKEQKSMSPEEID